jgi:DNA-binding transcriptional regulator YiaG
MEYADNGTMKAVVAKRNMALKRSGANGADAHSLKEVAFTTHHTREEFSVRTFCGSFGVTQDSFTRLTGFSPRAVAHWASGRSPSGSAQKRLTELTRLFDELSEMVETKAIGEWLKQSNPAFDGSTPLQVIERGETDRIWRMIWELQSGNTG